MRTRRFGQAATRSAGRVRVLVAPLAGVVVLLAGLGFLLAPATPAAAQPPAQGWTTTEAPLPNDAGNGSTNPHVYTASSDCRAANACVTVGWYEDTAGFTWGLIEQQNGTTWTDTEAPQPPNHGTGGDQGFWFGSANCGIIQPCRAVSCPTSTFCVAVGSYLDTAGFTEPVVDTYANGSWSSAEGALPSDTATDSTTPHADANLFAVSCVSVTSCTAIGSYTNTSGNSSGYLATLSGTTWSATSIALPSGANPDGSNLTSVSCTGTFCAAGGSVVVDGDVQPWLVTVANGSVVSVQGAIPPSSGFGENVEMDCPSISQCFGVGFSVDTGNSDFEAPLIEMWNGSSWSDSTPPLPLGTNGNFNQLSTVSCASVVNCVAAGILSTPSGDFPLIETYANGAWSGSRAPIPSDADPSSSQFALFEELSCPTPAFCMATGGYDGPGGRGLGLVDTFSAGSWTTSTALVPSNLTSETSGQASYARTVSCASPVACTVSGYYTDTSGNNQGFLDTWTGAQGYWLDASDGGIFTYPNNTFYGSTGGIKLNKPMVGMAPTPDGQGYFLVASDGGIFTYGDAQFHGSRGGQPLNKPIVGMATTPDGQGYWLVASDGGIFTYGDANYYGSRGGQPINAPIVGIAATPDGGGYWLVGSDGGIYSYGDALFYGSTGGLKLNKPVVGMAASPSGLGYWLVASDGGVFNYGAANFYGSTGSIVLNKPVVGLASSPSGLGYWLVASDGGIFNYGDANFEGSAGSLHLNAPVVGMAGG